MSGADPHEAVASAAANAALAGVRIDPEWSDAVRAALDVAGGVDELIAGRARALGHMPMDETAGTYTGVASAPDSGADAE